MKSGLNAMPLFLLDDLLSHRNLIELHQNLQNLQFFFQNYKLDCLPKHTLLSKKVNDSWCLDKVLQFRSLCLSDLVSR